MSVKTKERDYLFDNYKALLIILVIIGHFIDPSYTNNQLLYTFKYVIYAFHMPAFIFISGYFSKKDTPWQISFQKILIPYFCFQTIYYLYYKYLLCIDTKFVYQFPKFSLWYLIALFVWKVVTPYVKKIPYHFLISVVMGLLFGFLPVEGTRFSISRIFSFYPYFLAGTLFKREKLTLLRIRKNYIIASCGILAYIMFTALFAKKIGFKLRFFFKKTSYADMGVMPLEGLFIRLLCYGIGFFFTYAIAILISEKKNFFSILGTTTMSIYLFHGLFYKFLQKKTNILKMVNTLPETLLLLVVCVALAFIFSLKPFCKFTNFFSNIKLPFFRKNNT